MTQAASTLMFCVGATKAGTSWLYSHLNRHPECHLRSLKELHYFDGIEYGRLEKQRARVEEMVQTLLKRLLDADADETRRAELSQRIKDRADWEQVLAVGHEDTAAYLNYLYDGADGRLVADITPAYGLLTETRLSQMARLTSDVRFVYLMRDPVDRMWSHVRMNSMRKLGGDAVDSAHAHRMLGYVLTGRQSDIAERSDYRAVLEKLDRAVPASKLLVLFYEDLFHGDGVARLSDFLGISRRPADTQRRVHAGVASDLDPKAAGAARDWLADQYEYIERRFGALPAAWRAQDAKV